jgi:hypothetical protein
MENFHAYLGTCLKFMRNIFTGLQKGLTETSKNAKIQNPDEYLF